MAGEKRAEATHRERAALGAQAVMSWPVDAEGNPMAIVGGAASDLFPTVQFGNVLVGPVTILRPVPNGALEDIIEEAAATQKAAEYVCGSERRIIQWAADPSTRIINPATGQPMPGSPAEGGSYEQPTAAPAPLQSEPAATPVEQPAQPVAPAPPAQ